MGILLSAAVWIAGGMGETEEENGFELDGFINPAVVSNVGCGAVGVLDEVLVNRGDFVKKGQILARLDTRVEQATVEHTRHRARMDSPIELRKARLDFATREFNRKKELFEKGAVRTYDRDEAETNMIIAQHELASALEQKRAAELEWEQAQEILNRRIVRSPLTGIVVERYLTPGELVNEQPILKLTQLDPLHVELIVPVSRWGQIQEGDRADVFPEEPVGGEYPAQVTVVDRVVDPGSGTFGVRLELPNKDYKLPSGLKCRVRFPLSP
ncbi:MAG TPA: efflux RND transporter periplasmic adaptor subunit [bacterium]|nr:efflux RND transporter periplasmic adaptor subunit [bacterium]HPP02058.1 efflux RND transporter periplasmic adaptor subunit [bacterium]HXK93032.1 efflux RND transporter periplasmic adaptor subunit [bacterium]